MYVLFVLRIWVDIQCILIGILNFEYMRLVFFLLVLGSFLLY
jgi:hypothetical protein